MLIVLSIYFIWWATKWDDFSVVGVARLCECLPHPPVCLPQGDLSQLGRVVLQGSFSVWISHKRAAVRMKELARFKPMQRHLFLYDHALLFCKRRDEDMHDRTPFYSFKSCLRVTKYDIHTLLAKSSAVRFNSHTINPPSIKFFVLILLIPTN